MKNIKKVLFMLTLLLTLGAVTGMAQIYVGVRPIRPVAVVRVEAPSPRHVYIDEDWHERNGGYEWNGGRWEAPPHPGYRYKAGYWDHDDHGHRWHQGRWHR